MNEENIYFHFGEKFNEEKTPKHINKNNFANNDPNGKYTKYMTDFAKENAYKNYDMCMEYYGILDKDEFNNSLKDILDMYPLDGINDLKKLKGKRGIYILVLEEYKQIYIGQSSRDLRERILRHFKKFLTLGEVPYVKYDTLPIDAFKPMDITKIFCMYSSNQRELDDMEIKYINKCPNRFLANKMLGGKIYNDYDFVDKFLSRIKKDIKNEIIK